METVDVVQEALESSEISATVNAWDEKRRVPRGHVPASWTTAKRQCARADKSPQFAFHTRDISYVSYINHALYLLLHCQSLQLPAALDKIFLIISAALTKLFLSSQQYSVQHTTTQVQHTTTQRKKKPFPSSGESTNHKIHLAKTITHTST
jgi:hypothetical protein